jgi:catechol 2,3-dioxygenase-like lactoylglutathione lyase family enzyme
MSMPTRLDHAVIGVSNLDAAIERFRALGFDTQPGGRHADGGTHNALIRFGLDYVELLAVYDEKEARARGRTINDELNGREAALIGYALATENIEDEATHFRGTEPEQPSPRAMGRNRPNGQALTWRVLTPGRDRWSWGRPWPFLIQWDTPDAERLRVDLPGEHVNGAIGWKHVAVAVKDFASACDIYRNQLGLKLVAKDTSPVRAARCATFAIGEGIIEVLAPDGDGAIQQVLMEKGEGPYALYFTVRDLAETRAFLEQQKIGFAHEAAGTGRLLIAPEDTMGVRIYLVG